MTDHPEPTESKLSELRQAAERLTQSWRQLTDEINTDRSSNAVTDYYAASKVFAAVISPNIILSLIAELEAARQEAAEAKAKVTTELIDELRDDAIRFSKPLELAGELIGVYWEGKADYARYLMGELKERLEAAAGTGEK